MEEDFAEALSRAVEASGLSLERVQHHLASRGVPIGLSTLSYWRRGRSRPERPESLRAVTLLEEILGLPAEELTSRLGPRRPRGRWTDRLSDEELGIHQLWEVDTAELVDILTAVDKPTRSPVTYLSLRDEQFVGADRRFGDLLCSGVARADVDGVDRFLAVQRAEPTDLSVATINAGQSCRLGRTRSDAGFVIAEIIFDRVLSAGETAVFDYRITPRPGDESVTTNRRFARGIREFVQKVNFDPAAVPAYCYQYRQVSAQEPEIDVRDLWIGTTSSTHVVALDAVPGIFGIRWEWPD